MIRPTLVSLLLLATLIAAGCSTPPPANRGQSGGRLDPSHDSPSEMGSLDLRSQDLVTATDQMAQDIASRLDITNRTSPPKIFVGEMENATPNKHQNYDIFLERLRAQLNSSGARHGLQFIRERAFIEGQRDREYGNKDADSTATAYRSAADYVLTGKISSLSSGRTEYYLCSFQLVQLREATSGPNVGAGHIVWENMYEVKFQ